jgi:hypothetical protein
MSRRLAISQVCGVAGGDQRIWRGYGAVEREAVIGLQGIGDVGGVGFLKEDHAEFWIDASSVIDDAVNEARFGDGAETDARHFDAVIAGAVGFGAGDEDFIGSADLRFGPMVPAFVGAAGKLVLIDDNVELVGAEVGGEVADAAFVEVAVVAG